MFEPISELAEINPPLRAPVLDRSDDLVSFIPMGDVSESGQWLTHKTRPLREVKSGFTPFQEGDVLIAKITPCMENGKGAHAVGLENGVGYGSTEFHVLRAKAENSPRYIFHISQSSSLRLKAEASMIGSAGQKRVPSEFFRKHRVFAPALTEQRHIAQILDTLDTQIHKTEALIAKLEKVKEGLLHDLLTRGIDDNGRLRPSPKQAPELYKESPLGLIPREWDISSAGAEFEITSGVTLGTHRRPKKYPTPYLRVANVHRDRLFLDEITMLEMTPAELEVKSLAVGDLLIVEGHANPNEIGRCAKVTEYAAGLTFQNHLFRLRASGILAGFASLWMNSNLVKGYWRATCSTSSGLYTINRTQLMGVPIAKPSKFEQNRIVLEYQNLKSRLKAEAVQLAKLSLQKQGLMDDLLTGRVRVTQLLDQDQATTPT